MNENSDSDGVLGNEGGSNSDMQGGSHEGGNPQDAVTVESLAKMVQGLESLNGRRGQEIGELRKMVASIVEGGGNAQQTGANADDVLSKFMDNPQGTISEIVSQVVKGMQDQQYSQAQTVTSKLKEVAPDFENYRDDIINAVVEDTGDESLRARLQNGIHELGVNSLKTLYRRVKAEKQLKERESLLKNLESNGVDIRSAKDFGMPSGSGDNGGSPKDPLAGTNFRNRSLEELDQLYANSIGKR